MGLESVTYISDFNTAWPVGSSDLKQDGDNHIRNVKLGVKNSFPNVSGAMTLTHTQLNDAALKGAGNIFGATQRIEAAGGGTLGLRDTTAPANEKVTDIQSGLGEFAIYSLTDAYAFGSYLVRAVRGGTTWDSLALAATVITVNGVNAANFARLDITNTFLGSGIWEGASPNLQLKETGVAANNGNWLFQANGEQYAAYAFNDAESVFTPFLTVDRTGTTIDSVALAATTVTVNGQNVRDTALFTSGTLGLARGGTGQTTQLGITREVTKAWTIQSDPGGTPSGTAGDVFAYY